jgi:PAS domain S-box-containing protein
LSVTLALFGLIAGAATTFGAVVWARLRALRLALHKAKVEARSQSRQTQFFRKVTEHASEGMTVLDMDGTLVWANPAYCRMMGRALPDMLGRHPQSFALPPDDSPSAETMSRFRFNPHDPSETGTTVFLNVRGDGTPFWNQLNTLSTTQANGAPP